jgi:hypothetical protein
MVQGESRGVVLRRSALPGSRSSGGGVAVNQFTDDGSEDNPRKDVGWPVGAGADTGVGDGAGQGDEHDPGGRAAASGGGGEGGGDGTV